MNSKDPILLYLKGKSICILGFGREGKSSLSFLYQHRHILKNRRIAVADLNPIDLSLPELLKGEESNASDELYVSEIDVFTGESYLRHIGEFDFVFKSPGISLKQFTSHRLGYGRLAEWPNTEISGQIDLFLRFLPSRHVVGITGTKGKSTTATLIATMLQEAGKQTYLVGNIGIPVLDQWEQYSADSYVVIELSSHQLQFVQASPPIAVITNFYPEHLDHYISYDEYLDSKLNLIRFQEPNGVFILNQEDADLVRRSEGLTVARIQPVSLADGLVFRGLNPDLMGEHHAIDVALAAAACANLGVREADRIEGIRSFRGIPHRCEFVGEYQGVRFYNDSIATIPQATLYAMRTLEHVDTLIVGGMDRGLDYANFYDELAQSDVRYLICLPDTGIALYRHFTERGDTRAVLAKDLEHAVDLAFKLSRPQKTCLFSPAASSYHQWKSFEERGNEFKALVRSRR